MIELQKNTLHFSFPEVHPQACLRIALERTLRIPDDGREYPLPPGLGSFPMRHIDDFGERVPAAWRERGGVLVPMYQAEALWISFRSDYLTDRQTCYPFAVQIATGKIDAVSGKAWEERLRRGPQNYIVAPGQPWLDGYCIGEGVIRQFVAMPLGAGYSAEEQLTGVAEVGGLQIAVQPMASEAFERHHPERPIRRTLAFDGAFFKGPLESAAPMGLAPGGRMRQHIDQDRYDLADWDSARSRCFVHLTNSMTWRAITGNNPPNTPVTALEYTFAGLLWFDYYSDAPAVAASPILAGLKSIAELGHAKGDVPLPENQTVLATPVVALGKRNPDQVREGRF